MFASLFSALARMILPRSLASKGARKAQNRDIRFDLQELFL